MLKDALQVSLVLLVTAFWAANGSNEKKSVKARSSLPRFFKWGQIDSDFVELFWNAKALGKGFADVIKLTALGITVGFTGMNYSHFKDEYLILTHLYPANTYKMVVEGVKCGRLVLFSTENVKTKPQGCHDATQEPVLMHSSLPNDEDTSYTY